MLGRLRLPINEAIRKFEGMWISISSEGHESHSLLPRRRIRAGYSEGLRKALDMIVPGPYIDIEGSTIVEPFRSDSSLCKTSVLFNIFSIVLIQADWSLPFKSTAHEECDAPIYSALMSLTRISPQL